MKIRQIVYKWMLMISQNTNKVNRRRTRNPFHYWRYFLIIPRVLKHKKKREEDNKRTVVHDMLKKINYREKRREYQSS